MRPSSENYLKWEEQFGDLDSQDRVENFPIDKYKYAFSWSLRVQLVV